MLPDDGVTEEYEEERGVILLLENEVASSDRKKRLGRSAQDETRIFEAGHKGIRALS
jgi:hypothetical protein